MQWNAIQFILILTLRPRPESHHSSIFAPLTSSIYIITFQREREHLLGSFFSFPFFSFPLFSPSLLPPQTRFSPFFVFKQRLPLYSSSSYTCFTHPFKPKSGERKKWSQNKGGRGSARWEDTFTSHQDHFFFASPS